MKSLKLIFLASFILTGCVFEESEKLPNTPSEVLNEFVRSSPIQHLDLDSSPIKHVHLSENNIIYSTFGQDKYQINIGRIKEFTFYNNEFYVYDNIQSAVFKIQKNGNVEGPLTTQGKGPGEHLVVTSLRSNNRYIYLPDWNNARINIYDENMILEGEIVEFKGDYRTKYIDLNDEIMLFSNPNKAGFISQAPEEGLISISHKNNPVDPCTTILPQIIPDGYQPQVYNRPNFSVNKKNEIATSYAPLPWIFVFDEELNMNLTLILNYSGFKKMDIPEMDFFKPVGNEGFGGAMPLRQFKLMDNGDIFISILQELFHLSPNTNGNYTIMGRYQFKISNEDDPIGISDVFSVEKHGKFYAGNWDYLFKFNLPD